MSNKEWDKDFSKNIFEGKNIKNQIKIVKPIYSFFKEIR